jgi:integrase
MAKRRINGDGTWWYAETENRFRAQYFDLDGRRRNLSARTNKEIVKKLRDALNKRESRTLEAMPSMAGTVQEMLQSFLEDKARKVEPRTLERYKLDIERYLIPELGKIRLTDLTSDLIEEAYLRIQQHNGKSGLSQNSMAHINIIFNAALKRAIKRKKIAFNPLDHLDTPKRKKSQVVPLTAEEKSRVIQGGKSKPLIWRLMWALHFNTGFRQGEILGLLWSDIDLTTGELRLHQQLQRQKDKGLVLKKLKSDAKSRNIYLDSVSLNLLKEWRKEQSSSRLKAVSWDSKGFVFTNSLGNPMEPRRASKEWAKLLREVNLPHFKLHTARHTFATLGLQNGFETKLITHYLGHSNSGTTVDIYQHMNEDILRNAALIIGKLAQ